MSGALAFTLAPGHEAGAPPEARGLARDEVRLMVARRDRAALVHDSFGSVAVLVWAAIVFSINAVYFPLVEEPDLRRRFGAAYDEYAAQTPRWIP